MVRVVGIMGSPRIGGNTDILLDAALEGAGEAGGDAEKVILEKLDLRGCRECESCFKTGRCILKDDMERIHGLLDEADVLIMASPIFFSGLTAQMKMMIDRCQCLWAGNFLLGKPIGGGRRRVGAFLSVGGRGDLSFNGAKSVVRAFFLTISVEYAGELLVPGIEGKGTISGHPSVLKEARDLGASLVALVK
ncbi:MAG: flavodoxin family protein [Methanomassiliicoccales archaeon]|nr:flavodoxin family protein [Methanomassiliicoccales archaeon]